jgi:hypothetical protein
MTDMPTSPPVGASPWELELFNHLTSHVEQERALLDEYATAAESTESKAFAYLANMLMEEERRHNATFLQMASSLKTEAELSGQDPAIPYMDFERCDRARVRELSENLLAREKADATELKRLHRELHDVKDTTLWDLLVSVMRRDTDTHISILEFVLRHTPRVEQ